MESKKTKSEIVRALLAQDLKENDEQELLELLIDNPIAIDIEKQQENTLTFGEKVADKFSEKTGSWGFIIGFSLFLIIWIILNAILLTKGFDPYPFILLNLILSSVAALQAPIIMMSQNRQSKKDSMRNHNDYRIDLKSELILEDLHNRMELSIKNQERILRYIQDQQLNDDNLYDQKFPNINRLEGENNDEKNNN